MRVTIIRETGTVNVDGKSHHDLDMSGLPSDFHALQWNNARGEIEFSVEECDHCGGRSKKPNAFISDLSPYQKYVDEWTAAEAAEAKAVAEAQAKAEAEKAANAAG